mgnify:CR=1 FL=1
MQRSCNACNVQSSYLEGLQEEAKATCKQFIASQGAEQCGFVILDL